MTSRIIAGLTILLMIGCGDAERNAASEDVRSPAGIGATPAASTPDAPAATADAGPPYTILFIGTSLTAGFGLPEGQGFPALLEERLVAEGLPYTAVNAGVSGETSAGALGRIDWLLRQEFHMVVLETGANDMLRGTDPATTEQNIREIVRRIRARNPDVPIVLAGMLALPNLGAEYARRFEAIYPRLADELDLLLIPFLLDGVAGEPALNQNDGIHPTAEGQEQVADNVWEVLGPLLPERM